MGKRGQKIFRKNLPLFPHTPAMWLYSAPISPSSQFFLNLSIISCSSTLSSREKTLGKAFNLVNAQPLKKMIYCLHANWSTISFFFFENTHKFSKYLQKSPVAVLTPSLSPFLSRLRHKCWRNMTRWNNKTLPASSCLPFSFRVLSYHLRKLTVFYGMHFM